MDFRAVGGKISHRGAEDAEDFFGRLKNTRTEDTETRSVFDGRCRKISHRGTEGTEEKEEERVEEH